MADRTSAAIFGRLFTRLAEEHDKNPKGPFKKLAHEFWGDTREYDFNSYQMDADDALIQLGLARHAKPGEENESGDIVSADEIGVYVIYADFKGKLPQS